MTAASQLAINPPLKITKVSWLAQAAAFSELFNRDHTLLHRCPTRDRSGGGRSFHACGGEKWTLAFLAPNQFSMPTGPAGGFSRQRLAGERRLAGDKPRSRNEVYLSTTVPIFVRFRPSAIHTSRTAP